MRAVHPGWWAAGGALGAGLAALALWLWSPGFGPASSDARMTEQVRAILLANPEIIPEAIERLQAREVGKLIAANRAAIETPYKSAWAGATDGDVVLVEFFDFACPYCRQSAADVDRLLAEDPKLKVVFRDFPVLGPESEQVARAALGAAEAGQYRAFHAAVFRGEGPLDSARLANAARAAGMAPADIARAFESPAIAAEIDGNLALGRTLGLTGTPSYVVGNRILSGAVGLDALKAAIAEARDARPAS
jgi:protein-disulfide isomerase